MRRYRKCLGAVVAVAALGVAAFTGTALAESLGSSASKADGSEAVATAAAADPAEAPRAESDLAPAPPESASVPTGSNSAASPDATTGDSGSAADPATTGATEAPDPGSSTNTNDSASSESAPTGEGSGTSAATVTPTENQPNVDPPATGCTSESVYNVNLAVGSTSATATFSIRPGCPGIEVTLASFTTPQAGMSFPQTLFGSSSGVFASGGPYTLTVAVPACFFQVDVIRGTAAGTLTTPVLPGGVAVAWAFGGSATECVSTTVETPPVETTTPPVVNNGTPPVQTPAVTTTTTTTPTTTTTTPTETTPAPTETTPASGAVGGKANTAAGTAGANLNVLGEVAKVGRLPFTGLSLLFLAAIGALLLLVGVGVKLAAWRGDGR